MPDKTVAELVAQLARRAPFDQAAGWDPVGLQLGDQAATVTTVAVCHEVTEEVVEATLAAGVGLLISYHPLLFYPTRRLVVGPSAEGRAYRLIRGGVNLAVVHTAFDVAVGGTADALAETLELSAVDGFGPLWGPETVTVTTLVDAAAAAKVRDAITGADGGNLGFRPACSFRSTGIATVGEDTANKERIEVVIDAGKIDRVVAAMVAAHPDAAPRYDVAESKGSAGFVGRVGQLGSPVRPAELAAMVDERLSTTSRVAAGGVQRVQRVAVLPGSGGSFISSAAASGADVLVTGDVGHHQARAAGEASLAVIDAGHAPTERPGVRKLYAAVSAGGSVTVDLTQMDVNPWEAD